jgi:hypothetical protein
MLTAYQQTSGPVTSRGPKQFVIKTAGYKKSERPLKEPDGVARTNLMRPIMPLLIVGALGCTDAPIEPQATGPATYRSYRTWDGAAVNSTLVEQAFGDSHILRGHTQLHDGTWLMEEATLDSRGRLIKAEIDRGGPCAEPPTHFVIDAKRGKIAISTAGVDTQWSVPNDLPWVPVGLLSAESSGHDVATPVAMTIALRSAAQQRATRLVDLQHFTSATIMSDQVLVTGPEPTVVLGDDYAQVEGDLPVRVHIAAFDRDLDANAPDLSDAWARLRCKNTSEVTAL